MRTIVSEKEFRQKLNQGWIFPAAMARRWGVSELTVRAGVKSGRLISVATVSGSVLLNPEQSRAGKLSEGANHG